MRKQLSNHKAIWVYIKLDGDSFASLTELDIRNKLEDVITKQEIGKLQGGGSGRGWMDFSFEVESIQAIDMTLATLRNLLAQCGVSDKAIRLEVVNQYDEICEDLPDFQPGDCLSYRFDDGDFGAALVLKQEDETLLGILDYKDLTPPTLSIFEKRKWLLSTHKVDMGQPHLQWTHCFGGVDVEIVGHSLLKDGDPKDCQFRLSWELIPEYFIRDKYRGNKELNPYEKNLTEPPDFQPGDCLSYRFDDGDFGAALVLKKGNDGPHSHEVLLGILDYKDSIPPTLLVFEQRKWLSIMNQWWQGKPYLVWVHNFKNIEFEIVGYCSLQDDDPLFCQFGLRWEELPEYILQEKAM